MLLEHYIPVGLMLRHRHHVTFHAHDIAQSRLVGWVLLQSCLVFGVAERESLDVKLEETFVVLLRMHLELADDARPNACLYLVLFVKIVTFTFVKVALYRVLEIS